MEDKEKDWKRKLTPIQYHVMREKGTEPPFSGRFVHDNKKGVYVCSACGNQLFHSDTMFDSGTGWPSFDAALPGAVKLYEDTSGGLRRTEAVCAKCDSHLGHLFDDGPTSTGQRYCINSVCLEKFDDRF
ncbi:MAG: peptide-methionine (R)-S-oxide reductase MsrB [Candidatus Taylorbacteria bacterium]|nr:peptide-methionine (R)-S-oxide reductase MsrB [Candidatus Taylorbacteria bacterium]